MNGFLGIYFDDQVYLDQVKQKLKYFICENDLVINKKNQGSSNPAKVIILKNGFWSQNLHRTMVISTTTLMVTSCLSYIGVYAYLIW